jgi:hypothetical protein
MSQTQQEVNWPVVASTQRTELSLERPPIAQRSIPAGSDLGGKGEKISDRWAFIAGKRATLNMQD